MARKNWHVNGGLLPAATVALAVVILTCGVGARAEEGIPESWDDATLAAEQADNDYGAYPEVGSEVGEEQPLDVVITDDRYIQESEEQYETPTEFEVDLDSLDSPEDFSEVSTKLEAMGSTYYQRDAFLYYLDHYITEYGSPACSTRQSLGPGGLYETIQYTTGVSLAHFIDYEGDGEQDDMLVCYAVPRSGWPNSGNFSWSPYTYYAEIWQSFEGLSSNARPTRFGNLGTYEKKTSEPGSESGLLAIAERVEVTVSSDNGEGFLPVVYLIEMGRRHTLDATKASGSYNVAKYYFNQFEGQNVGMVYSPYQFIHNRVIYNASNIKAYGAQQCIDIAKETQELSRGYGRSVFADVNDSTPHISEVRNMLWFSISEGWVEPGGLRTFRGMDTVKRQDMAAFLFRVAQKRGVVSKSWQPNSSQMRAFSDVDSSTPHAREIWWLASVGISTGFPDGTFRGMDTVKRQDMAAFIFRLGKMIPAFNTNDSWQPTLAQRSRFSDVNTSTPHCREVWWFAAKRITEGYPDGTFRGMDSVYRQDMAAFLYRVFIYGIVY